MVQPDGMQRADVPNDFDFLDRHDPVALGDARLGESRLNVPAVAIRKLDPVRRKWFIETSRDAHYVDKVPAVD